MSVTEQKFELSEIVELKELDSTEKANKYLKSGWTLISTHLWDYGHPVERHQKTIFILGWRREQGDPVHPWRERDPNDFGPPGFQKIPTAEE